MRSYKFVQTIARPFLSFKTRLSAPPLIWKWFFILIKKTTPFQKKGCALGLILKVTVFGTRKWPIADKSLIDNGHFSFGMQNLLHDTLVNIRSKILGE